MDLSGLGYDPLLAVLNMWVNLQIT